MRSCDRFDKSTSTSWNGGVPGAVSGALYLSTPALVMLFAVFHLQWRAPTAGGELAGLDTKHDL
jgi:hypothetical protein